MKKKKLIISGASIVAVCVVAIAVFAIFSGIGSKRVIQGVTIYDVNPVQAKKLITEYHPLILDVRTEKEYNAGHIQMAKNIPIKELPHRFIEIRDFKDKKIFLYCRSGRRSTYAALMLGKSGYKHLYNLKKGIRSWIAAGYEVVQVKNESKDSFP